MTVSIENICEEEIELQRAEVNIATISTGQLITEPRARTTCVHRVASYSTKVYNNYV